MESERGWLRSIGNYTLLIICLFSLTISTSSTGLADFAPLPLEWWSSQEKWVWEKILAGKVADFNDEEKKEIDPRNKDNWGDKRDLRQEFLRYILFKKEYRDAIPFEGVQIKGARFKDKIYLPRFDINFQLVLENCRFEQGADFTNIKVTKRLSFSNSYFEDSLPDKAPDSRTVDLISVQVEEHLSLDGVTIKGLLDMGGLHARSLSLGSSTFLKESYTIPGQGYFEVKVDSLRLINAQIDHWLSLDNAEIESDVNMNNLQVGHNLDMVGAKIDGMVSFDTAKIDGKLKMERATISGELNFYNAKVGLLNIGLCKDCIKKTNLRKIDLRAFQYEDIDAPYEEKNEEKISNEFSAYIRYMAYTLWDFICFRCKHPYQDQTQEYLDWLDKSDPNLVSPQPYRQIASVLMRNGYNEQSNNILYEMEKKAWKQDFYEKHYFNCFVKFLQFISSGFGYKYIITLVVAAGFIIMGSNVAKHWMIEKNKDKYKDIEPFFFSFDRLIPLIRLRNKHYEVDIERPVRIYFYVHQTAGYVLGLFIGAALSGLAK
jgi:hypothetical protein